MISNLARIGDPDAEIAPFLRKIAAITDRKLLSDLCHEFLYRFPPQRGLELAAAMSWANPLFMAEIPEDSAKVLALSAEEFAEFVMRAKLTATRADHLNVVVACAPKTGSTFLQDALRKALSLPLANLYLPVLNSSALGADLMEQEPDELALIRSGLGRGYVAQHHMRCSPYVARQLDFYHVRPIVTHRNIFDTLVSLDDMILKGRQNEAAPGEFFTDGLPVKFATMSRDDRLLLLAHRYAVWLVQFYMSWKKCESAGLIRPLWISYEQDLLGDKLSLGRKIADFLGSARAPADKIAAALGEKPGQGVHRFNQGIAGRGQDMPDAVRDHVLKVAEFYGGDVDLSALVGA